MNFDTKILEPTKKNIALAAAEIKNGGLVAFATETVYGLGADAFNTDAVKKIFAVKGRPSDNPLILHFANLEDMQKAGHFNQKALMAARAFMPGPLTIVVKKKPSVPDVVTARLDTVALRIPSAPKALQFLKECALPVAAPSANLSGSPSPTTARHVFDDMSGKIKYILDGGATSVGIESTIIDFSVSPPRLLRLGGISVSQLEKVVGEVSIYNHNGDKPLSPGMKYRHYAPLAKVVAFDFLSQLKEECLTADLKGVKTLVLLINPQEKFTDFINFARRGGLDKVEFVVYKNEEEYAAGLYDRLRYADKSGCGLVLCQLTKGCGVGQAVNNRLLKAANN